MAGDAPTTHGLGLEGAQTDLLAPGPVMRFAAALDRDEPAPLPGSALPPLAHWMYFLPQHRASQAGPDGHPLRTGFPDSLAFPRRMWAGGRLQWHRPLRIGQEARRVSRLASLTRKAGRSGELVFALLRHEIGDAQGLAVAEEQDLVYRTAARPGEATVAGQPAPGDAAWQAELVPDEVLLFRYSALTWNSHRIHYDRRYATQVEGYPGLVVHGPLIATLLADLAVRRSGRALRAFRFRAQRPVFDGQSLRLCGRPAPDGASAVLWSQDHQGFLAMQAEAEFA